ncbi:MAG: hypothetical protein WDZ59_15185 [Pirellulales bacterium]
MSQPNGQIERIVQEVMRRLRTSGSTSSGVASSATSDASESGGELRIDRRLISLSYLEGRLDGVRHVRIPVGAVVTPSARDLLTERGVRLATAAACQPCDTTAAESVIGVVDSAVCIDQLAKDVEREGLATTCIAAVGLVEAVKELTEVLHEGQGRGVLVTARAAAAVCLANRQRGLRAVEACGDADDEKRWQSVAANLLVVDPAGMSRFGLTQLAKQFLRAEAAECPAELREALG